MRDDPGTADIISKPEAVKSGAYAHGDNGLALNGVPRASLVDLKPLFGVFPSRAQVKLATKVWVMAQLQLYGIPFKKSDIALDLKIALRTAVNEGFCDSLPPSTAALEARLSQQFRQRVDVYNEAALKRRAEIFSRLESPTEEAAYDPDLFLAKYFLTADKAKQKDSLFLKYCRPGLTKAVRKISGLTIREPRGRVVYRDVSVVVRWEESFERAIDDLFAKISNHDQPFVVPTVEANFDIHHFMAKYFLDGLGGKPDPKKTPEPITLYSFLENEWEVRAAFASIPGLQI
ncbi:hypothetical protein SI65_07272 [Aspergillus cristatus]|uniref:Uncharacterized protein n=1 Tax=Aspergillus cristatus TaxID=573508 RepID=A0A1E3B9H7_ASPCR|nr:hypothetical protein SI65_07272 [Aspergillus cristatus]